MKNSQAEYEDFVNVFRVLEKTTENYLFILDYKKDHYTITSRAAERFNLEEHDFDGALEKIMKCVYPEDREMLEQNLESVRKKELPEHDLEYRWLDKKGNPVWISCRGQLIFDESGEAHYLVGRIQELGRKNKIDDVTGLYREIVLKDVICGMDASMAGRGFMLLIGVDNFKDVNDRYGKQFGDKILRDLAACVTSATRGVADVFRMSGDEIMVFCDGLAVDGEEPAKELYKKIRRAVDERIVEEAYRIFYTVSGGAVYFDESNLGNIKLIEQAEFALRLAKEKGKNMCVRYDEEAYGEYVTRLEMQECLRKSVENGFEGFSLNYQPIVNIKKASVLGAEALLRWKNERFGSIAPSVFIPLLEESGLIIPVGRWVIQEAMEQSVKWQEKCEGFRININISFVQLKKSNVIRDIDRCVEKLDFDIGNVLFEITESGELEAGYATNILEAFHKKSLSLGIDDFGTGYSNLRYIKDMMFNLVKIDQAFIKDIRNSKYDYMVVKQFTELAHSLNLNVCYEGVETEEDFNCVLELEPDYIQGFYFSKPVCADTFEKEFLGKKYDFSV